MPPTPAKRQGSVENAIDANDPIYQTTQLLSKRYENEVSSRINAYRGWHGDVMPHITISEKNRQGWELSFVEQVQSIALMMTCPRLQRDLNGGQSGGGAIRFAGGSAFGSVKPTVLTTIANDPKHQWGSNQSWTPGGSVGPPFTKTGGGTAQLTNLPTTDTLSILRRSVLCREIRLLNYAQISGGSLTPPVTYYVWCFSATDITSLSYPADDPYATEAWIPGTTLHVDVQCAVSTEKAVASAGGMPSTMVNGNWSPHNQVLYSETGRAGPDTKYMWTDAGGTGSGTFNGVNNPSAFTIGNTVAVDAYSVITATLYRWTGLAQEEVWDTIQLTSTNAGSANSLNTIVVPLAGRYRLELQLSTNLAQGSSTVPSTTPFTQGSYSGQFYFWFQCICPWALAHLPADQILQYLNNSNQIRILGYDVTWTNLASAFSMNGEIYAVQIVGGQDWFATIFENGYGQVSDYLEQLDGVVTYRCEKGLHTFLFPTNDSDMDLQSEYYIAKSNGQQATQCGSNLDSKWGLSDFTVVYASVQQNPTNSQNAASSSCTTRWSSSGRRRAWCSPSRFPAR